MIKIIYHLALYAVVIFVISGCNHRSKNSVQIINSTQLSKSEPKWTCECLYTDLSSYYDFKVNSSRLSNELILGDSCAVELFVIAKKTQKSVDSIFHSSVFLSSNSFNSCGAVGSYSQRDALYYGSNPDNADLMIADVNFDDREDILIMNNWGQGLGTNYDFYLQDSNQHFHLDAYLTDSVKYFPKVIDKKDLILRTRVQLDGLPTVFIERSFIYNLLDKKWRFLSTKELEYDPGILDSLGF